LLLVSRHWVLLFAESAIAAPAAKPINPEHIGIITNSQNMSPIASATAFHYHHHLNRD
jgi:hypothetical protein